MPFSIVPQVTPSKRLSPDNQDNILQKQILRNIIDWIDLDHNKNKQTDHDKNILLFIFKIVLGG